MRVLFDTNVVLDVLLERHPFSETAAAILSRVEKGEVVGFLCATTITTIYYLVSKATSRNKANECIKKLLTLFEIAAANRPVLETARDLNFKDFEDAIIYASALHSGCNCVVTRNIKDFSRTEIPVFSPEEFLKILEIKNELDE